MTAIFVILGVAAIAILLFFINLILGICQIPKCAIRFIWTANPVLTGQ
jgi:hypothetical protein